MSLPNELLPVGLLGTGAAGGGYQIQRSLRFNSADSAYLSRTPASAGNRKTWTWAGWVKRTAPGTGNYLFMCQPDASNYSEIYFDTDDKLKISNRVGGTDVSRRFTTAVYRDVSAWYHIVVASNSSSLLKVYVNGLEVTEFSTSTGPTTADWSFNSTSAHGIGANSAGTGYFLNGFLADIHFIDGQALDPTSFGEFDTNGIWQPIEYQGEYGTNGFHLPFSDNSTASALGTDTSGNGNTWTVNNISVAAGAGNDSLVDTPTNGSQTDTGVGGEVVGNYGTLNPVSNGTGTAPTNGNLNLAVKAGVSTRCNSTIGVSSGKWYFETTLVTAATDIPRTMIAIGQNYLTTTYPGGDALSYGFALEYGAIYNNNVETTGYGSTLTDGDIFMCAFDLDNNKIFFGKNGTWYDSSDPETGTRPAFTLTPGTYCPCTRPRAAGGGGPTPEVALNFGQRPFAYTAPSGFKALCTTNLPEPTIADGSTAMDVKLYTGNGSTQTISGLEFSPDLVWVKNRAAADNHKLLDTIRGATNELESNTTDAEVANADGLTAFNSDGFDLGADVEYNTSSEAYVAWTWDAGSSTVENTDGTITSQVRASPTSGCSIVTYSGNGTDGATIGHGLNVAPQMVIIKRRNAVDNWPVYHTSLGGGNNLLFLETADAKRSDLNVWSSTAPSSSVITIGDRDEVNNNTSTYVAYCFAPVDSYSSFGSYTGNGSSDGPFVYLGFRPRFLLWKSSSYSTGDTNWVMFDSARSPYNRTVLHLRADLGAAEASGSEYIDLCSNGFKLRYVDANNNANGQTYIYAAFAENPFSVARAR